jgi:hypothetical protein
VNLYEEGILSLGAREGNPHAEAGQLGAINMPAAVAARMTEIGTAIEALGAAIATHAPPPAQLTAWEAWRVQWDRFLADWRKFAKDTDYIDRMWGATATQIESYAASYAQWSQAFARQWRGQVIAPVFASAAPQESAWAKYSKLIAMGVGVSLGTALILSFIRGRR